MLNFRKLIMFSIIVPTISACNTTTNIRKHQDFEAIFPKYKTIAVVEGAILIHQTGKDGLKNVITPNQERVSNILKAASSELKAKGYDVTDIMQQKEDDVSDSLNAAYSKSITNLYFKEGLDKKENAFSTTESIGVISKELAKKSNPDMLMVIGYQGSEMNQSEVFKNFAKDVALNMIMVPTHTNVKEGAAFISLIERNTGKVLWANRGIDEENYDASLVRSLTNHNVMETAFSRAFKELPDKTKVN